ncbi:hypothetical protein NKDENANG_00096 [Candidatus Entotheonellaceae bacterium PAL068K]
MTLSVPRVRHYLREFNLEKLFIEELGWDRHTAQLAVKVNARTYTLDALAEKRGVQIFQCQPDTEGDIPDYATRRKLDTQVTKSAYEHLIIFVDAAKTLQIWQWVARQPGQPTAYREHHYHTTTQSGEALIQKLESITFGLSEEEGLTLTGVIFRLRDAFDRDRVTRRFYDRFKKEHAVFLGFIKGLTDRGDKEWYASLMLNRLMFVYFIQRKGFLDGDTDYLKNRLITVQQRQGKGRFLTFYRYFLLRLFHEGFAQQPAQRASDLEDLLGHVPYLNGGLFEVHTLEQKHTGIDIPDEAFEPLFAFFDQYEWHLDTRPLRHDKEINPDVLGYIFEKYINQKQMGAYYTKEDITEYISKSTLIPYLFDAAEKKCAIAFQPGSALWQLLQTHPDRYLYESVRQGVDLPLPESIARGIEDVNQRGDWNRPATPEFALPTETWREHMARRQRCQKLREKLQAGDIQQINDLITYNLDLRQFVEDVLADCEGPELLRAFYQALSSLTVLDPTCGSGAFLFAALNSLEPLYESCLDRMQAFVDDLERSGKPYHPGKFADFRRILAEVARHPNRRYFILKSIIINNLYGVDIMEEAVEICKLRLFLKLVAQVDRVKDLEPLPDIDFNIRPGNTLVGFVSVDEIRRAAESDRSGQGQLIFGETETAIRRIEEEAEIVERAFQTFHNMQTDLDMDAREFTSAKQELRGRLTKLADELDCYLAGEYGVDPDETRAYNQWRDSHQPFHWFAEFYGIMSRGGFDVIIGNPPYVEYRRVWNDYRIEPHNYMTESAKNLYAFCTERSTILLQRQSRFGMIIPSSAIGLDNTACLRDVLHQRYSTIYCSTYSTGPSKLFEGVDQRLCIVITHVNSDKNRSLFTTCYHHWHAEERDALFATLTYIPSIRHNRLNRIVQLGDIKAFNILRQIEKKAPREIQSYYSQSRDDFLAHYHRSPRYWIRAMDFEQYFRSPTRSRSIHHFRDLLFVREDEGKAICAIINSSLFFFWFMTICNGRNLTAVDVGRFPIGEFEPTLRNQLAAIFTELMEDYKDHSFIRERSDCEYQEFRPNLSKPILDKIDRTLAEHYGFTDKQLDFIINYDIKYRMGLADGNNES